jgi:hypothetical protein
MPLLNERWTALRDAGTVLCAVSSLCTFIVCTTCAQKFGGKFRNMLDACDHSAVRLIQLVVDNIDSYRDVAQYQGCTGVPHKTQLDTLNWAVSFLKRAQILASDVNGCLGGAYFTDMHELTMFADYRVPQVGT